MVGNAYQIRVKGQWTTSPILYVMLVGKTPPLDFAYQPIQDEDSRRYAKYIDELEQYERDCKIFKTKLRDGEIAEEPGFPYSRFPSHTRKNYFTQVYLLNLQLKLYLCTKYKNERIKNRN
jgi:hypothetical protein